jgi:hypothetical protein
MAMYSQGCSQVVKRVQTGQIAGLTKMTQITTIPTI